jgi:hypothetical protein
LLVLTVGGELVSHQLGVVPDANDIWEVEDGLAGLGLVGLWLSDIDLHVVNLGEGAGWLTPGGLLAVCP